jgi:hypothetical protein
MEIELRRRFFAEELEDDIGRALMAGPGRWTAITRIRRDPHEPEASCWLHGLTCCVST